MPRQKSTTRPTFRRECASICLASLTSLVLLEATPPTRAEEANIEFFETRIRPLLAEHCYDCHGEKKQKGGLRLDSRESTLKGGDSGTAVIPGKVEDSLLIKAIRYTDKDLQMPPPAKDGTSRQLPAESIANLEAWVKMGAPDPRSDPPAADTPANPKMDLDAARKLWAFHAPADPAIPSVRDNAWARNNIDRFVLTKLESKELRPAGIADKRTMIRRATFDLTGLPPTIAEVDAFLSDPAPDAFAKLIDRLLASPRYGERWARHWLDVVRYTDSFDARVLSGDSKMDCTDAWRYRDWVVDAFNRDLPYDQFIIQQVAGDLLTPPEDDPRGLIATGVYTLGNWGGGDADKDKLLTDIADDQVDLTGRAFLGLTLACARCHDHKFDPISTEDYYGLAGIFFSSHFLPNPGPKTNGPEMLRIPLLSREEKAKRESSQRRIDEITSLLANTPTPLTEVKRDVLGKPGLIGWSPKGADNPSVVINTTDKEIAFLTIKLPAYAIALHPGPKQPVSAIWRSPMAGKIWVKASLRDADPTCGDGIAWSVRKGRTLLGSGQFENGGNSDFPEQEAVVSEGDFVTLSIDPKSNYFCDSTAVDLIIRAADGRSWNLRQTLVSGGTQGQDGVWWICAGEGDHFAKDLPESAELAAERKRLTDELASPIPTAHGLQEGGCPQSSHAGVHDVKVHIRGRYDRLGPIVPRHFPKLLAGDSQPPITQGSGRLELARWLASNTNPTTARVMVNRIWQHHFGQGIVRTPNNFGKLGDPPDNPELLDWLAEEFIRSGWSIKAMHRLIMLSSTYQQSSAAAPETLAADPDNHLFGRMSRSRLESEALRDSLLAVAGKLDTSTGGRAFRDFATPRRTLYLMTVRSDRGTYQSLFDAADPTAIADKRVDSTVAPQALFLLNNPFVLNQAEALVQRMQAEGRHDDAGRISWLYQTLYARPPGEEETRIGQAALTSARNGATENLAWQQYVHALLCTNEFIYID